MKRKGRVIAIMAGFLLSAGILGMTGFQAEAEEEGISIQDTFSDEAVRTYIKKEFDHDWNGFLSEEEIELATYIYVEHDMKSLKGIEVLTSLTELTCDYGQIESLDLSHNKALLDLEITNTTLSGLNLSENTELKYLMCRNCGLTNLDLSANTKLETLDCSENALTELNVNGLSNIVDLFCTDNQLTGIDTSANPELKRLFVSSNLISSLDVSKNVKLEELACAENCLTALDVSNNPLITYLNCSTNSISTLDVENLNRLWILDCSVNHLSDLYVRKNTRLSFLYCGSNSITSLDLSQCPNLHELGAQNSGMEYLVIVKNKELIGHYLGIKSAKQSYRDGFFYQYEREGYGTQYHLTVDTRTKVITDRIGWKKSGSKWWYLYMDGTYAKDDWISESGKWYYFGSNGYMVTGWKQINGKWYYFGSTGVMQTGWKKISGYWYYFSSQGLMQTGWKMLSGKYYYFRDDGSMETSAYRDGYWLDSKGVCNTKRMATWRKSGSRWWFGDQTGWYAKERWLTIDGKEYYFMKNGFLAVNQWIGNYYVGSDGSYAGKVPPVDWKDLCASQVPDYTDMISLLEWYGQYHRYYDHEFASSAEWSELFFYRDLCRKGSPVAAKKLSGEDPLGKVPSYLSKYLVSEKDAKWYAKWVLNMSDEQIRLAQRKSDTNYYLKEGYYYFWEPGIGGPGYEVTKVSVSTDGSNYYVDYTLHLYNSKSTVDDTKMHAVLTRRYGKGKSFWSIYMIETGEK